MRTLRITVALLCIVGLTFSAYGQPAAAPMPKAKNILDVIPADTLGYVVVNNVKAASGHADRYLEAIGVDKLTKANMPNGLLELIKQGAMLGEGFNPNGGFAVTMLDPQQFGIDLMAMIQGGPGAKPDQKVPIVFFLPGTSVKDLFSKYKMEEAGKYTKVELRMGPSYAVQMGDYVAFSQLDKALDAVTGASKKASSELGTQDAMILAKSDVAVHANMKIGGPIMVKILQQMEEQMKEMTAPGMPSNPFGSFAGIMEMYRTIVSQLDALTLAVRMEDKALVMDIAVAFQPESVIGKAMAGFKLGGKPLLGGVPNIQYALAAGSIQTTQSAEAMDFSSRMMDMMFNAIPDAKVTPETKTKIKGLSQSFNEQVTATQLVIGGAPEGSGLIGAAVLMKCKDAEAVKGLLGQTTELIQTLITQVAPNEPDAKKIKVTYTKAAETVGIAPVDVINITAPDLENLKEKEKADMIKILGEAKINFRVVAPDATTVLLTIGGGKEFLAQALVAAKSGTNAVTDAAVGDAASAMPKNPIMILMLNGANISTMITRIAKEVAGEEVPFKVTAQAPLVIAAGVDGPAEHLVIYIPNALVKDIVSQVMAIFMPMPPPSSQPMQGGGNF